MKNDLLVSFDEAFEYGFDVAIISFDTISVACRISDIEVMNDSLKCRTLEGLSFIIPFSSINFIKIGKK